MKRIILLIYFLLFISGYSFGQPTFSNRYLQGLEICNLIDLAPDNGYYFCGRSTDSDIILGKTDSAGNLQWARKMGYSFLRENPFDMVVLSNGNVVVALVSDSGSFSSTARSFVFSFDVNGNHIFTKKFINSTTGNTNTVNNIIKDGNGFSMSIANDTPLETRILKCDSLGNKLNSIHLQNNYNKLFKTSAGYYFVYDFVGISISKFNSSFSYQGSRFIPNGFNSYGIIEISNNSFVLYGGGGPSGYGELFNFNVQMQPQWAKWYSLPNSQSIGKIATGHRIAANSILFYVEDEYCGATPCNPYFLKIDTLGAVKKCEFLTTGGSNTDYVSSKSVFRNGIFTFIQNEKISIFQPALTFKINSVDTALSQVCDGKDTIAIAHSSGTGSSSYTYSWGTSNDSLADDTIPFYNITFTYGDCNDSTLFINQIKNKKIDFSIFPNPTSDYITIQYNLTSAKEISVEIFNVYGQQLKNFRKVDNKQEMQLSLKDFPAGIYFVKMMIAGKEEVRKVLKE